MIFGGIFGQNKNIGGIVRQNQNIQKNSDVIRKFWEYSAFFLNSDHIFHLTEYSELTL